MSGGVNSSLIFAVVTLLYTELHFQTKHFSRKVQLQEKQFSRVTTSATIATTYSGSLSWKFKL